MAAQTLSRPNCEFDARWSNPTDLVYNCCSYIIYLYICKRYFYLFVFVPAAILIVLACSSLNHCFVELGKLSIKAALLLSLSRLRSTTPRKTNPKITARINGKTNWTLICLFVTGVQSFGVLSELKLTAAVRKPTNCRKRLTSHGHDGFDF